MADTLRDDPCRSQDTSTYSEHNKEIEKLGSSDLSIIDQASVWGR